MKLETTNERIYVRATRKELEEFMVLIEKAIENNCAVGDGVTVTRK